MNLETNVPETVVAISKSWNSSSYSILQFSDYVLTSKDNSMCLDPNFSDIISTPHSNSYLDLNGDCMPDIFLTKVNALTKEPYFQIYV